MAVCRLDARTLLLLALSVPVTGFQVLRPSFGPSHVRGAHTLRCKASSGRPVHSNGDAKKTFGLALMDPPHAKDDAAKREFELNRGLAVDTLLADYPTMFSQSCDLSIFHENIVLKDTQGFTLEGIRSYKVCTLLSLPDGTAPWVRCLCPLVPCNVASV